MTNKNFLSNIRSPFLDSPSSDVGHRRRVVADLLPSFCRVNMLKLVSVLALIFTLGVGNAWGTVTIETTVGTYASAHSWSNETAYSSISMDSYATATAGGTGNNGKYYTSNSSWRFYENGTGSVTITVPAHYYLKQVSITFSKGNNGTIKLNGSSSVTSGTLYSVTGTSAAFNTISHSSGTKAGNIQITKIKAVYYVPTVLTLDKNGGDSDGSANIGYNDGTYTSFTAATRAGYTCKGYYTATSAGTKVLNADGTRASSSVSGWWTSNKWSKDAAEATLYAQWEAAASVAVTGVTVSPTSKSIIPGETFDITPTISPSNATDKVVSWTSSATSYATVSSGTVTGVAAGSSTITCTTHDGSYTATCAVTVRSVTLQALDEDGNAIGVGGPGAPTRSGTTITAAADAGNYVFKQWDITNATAASTTTSPTTLSNPTGNVTVTAVYYKPITITYKANNTTFTTQTYARGGTLAFPASNPDGATYSCTGKTFMGWVAEANKNYSHASTPPTYATAGGSVTAAATYYAVFATSSGSGSGSVVLSYTSLGLTTSYESGSTKTVSGIDFYCNDVMTGTSGSDGYQKIQFKKSSTGPGYIYNSEAMPGNITSIVLSSTTRDMTVNFGTSSNPDGSTETTTCTSSSLTATPSGNYKYFKILDAVDNAAYTGTITINYSSVTYSDYATTCCTALGSINGSVFWTG